jgi:hypothetical protein
LRHKLAPPLQNFQGVVSSHTPKADTAGTQSRLSTTVQHPKDDNYRETLRAHYKFSMRTNMQAPQHEGTRQGVNHIGLRLPYFNEGDELEAGLSGG